MINIRKIKVSSRTPDDGAAVSVSQCLPWKDGDAQLTQETRDAL